MHLAMLLKKKHHVLHAKLFNCSMNFSFSNLSLPQTLLTLPCIMVPQHTPYFTHLFKNKMFVQFLLEAKHYGVQTKFGMKNVLLRLKERSKEGIK